VVQANTYIPVRKYRSVTDRAGNTVQVLDSLLPTNLEQLQLQRDELQAKLDDVNALIDTFTQMTTDLPVPIRPGRTIPGGANEQARSG
jgi:hypothetical protein